MKPTFANEVEKIMGLALDWLMSWDVVDEGKSKAPEKDRCAARNKLKDAVSKLAEKTYSRKKRKGNVMKYHSEAKILNGLHKDGCVYVCSDPECNMPTFGENVVCCEHCGKTEHRYSHPGGMFDKIKQAFVCSTCGEEYHTYGTQQLRNLAMEGKLPDCVPEFVSGLFSADMTREQIQERINLLSSEIDANEEENSIMQSEITALYKKIDTLK